jgi:hypothetical protein
MKTTKKKVTPLPKLLAKAQAVFNSFIRERDKDAGCITCGKQGDQAGHYWPVKYSGVRFDEINVNIQETYCNKWCYGNQALYRMKLVERYGEEKIKELDERAVRTQKLKWCRYELEQLIETYKGKIAELKKAA